MGASQVKPVELRTWQDWLVSVRLTVTLLEVAVEGNEADDTPEVRLLESLRAALNDYDRKTGRVT